MSVCRHCGRERQLRPRGLCYHCYAKTDIRERYPVAENFRASECGWVPQTLAPPGEPTVAPPGSEEKIQAFTARAERREPIFHPGDLVLWDPNDAR